MTNNSGNAYVLALTAFNVLTVLAAAFLALALYSTTIAPASTTNGLMVLILLQYGIYMLVGLCFMRWLHTYLKTVQISSSGDTGTSSDIDARWAYLGFGTPWLNLFMPYQIIRKLLRRAAPNTEKQIHSIAALWWCLHLFYFISTPALLVLLHYDLIGSGQYELHALCLALGSLIVIGICRSAYRLVSHLQANA
ncbi:MAG: DUF4328 domain-containing protein [Halioglobus sp.]